MQTPEPTHHGPGSEGKIDVLTSRYANGELMWHPDDETQCSVEPRSGAHPGEVGKPVAIEPGVTFDEEGGE